MPNKIINTPDLLKSFPIATSGGTSSSFSSANIQEIRSSNPEKSKGVIGTRGPSSPISPDAFPLTKINALTNSSGATTELRKRAVKIALSYVGANETPGNNSGWWDSVFQSKMLNLPQPWKSPRPWCNYFTNLVWIEAFTTGNALVGVASNPTWANTFKNVFDSGKKNRKEIIPDDKFLLLSAGTSSTMGSFKKSFRGKYFISKEEAKSGKKLPQPGDMVRYNGSHIEIITKVYIDKSGKMTGYDFVSGNSGPRDPRDGGGLIHRTNRSINTTVLKGITGFLVLSDTYS